MRTANHGQAFGVKGKVALQRSEHGPLWKKDSVSQRSNHLQVDPDEGGTQCWLEKGCQPSTLSFSRQIIKRKSPYLNVFYILASNLTNQGQNAVLTKPCGSPVVNWIERRMTGRQREDRWLMMRHEHSRLWSCEFKSFTLYLFSLKRRIGLICSWIYSIL